MAFTSWCGFVSPAALGRCRSIRNVGHLVAARFRPELVHGRCWGWGLQFGQPQKKLTDCCQALSGQQPAYSAASLSFLSARALMRTVAGLAANTCSCLVKGLMPLRLGLAGIFCTSILSRPGSVKD